MAHPTRQALIIDDNTTVELVEGSEGEPSRLHIGDAPYGITLVGPTEVLRRLIVGADTQLAKLTSARRAS